MAVEDITIRHQNYIEFTGLTAIDIGSKFDFDTDKTVEEFIAALPQFSTVMLADGVSLDRKYVVVLDEKGELVTDHSLKVTHVIGNSKTIGVDFKEHMVLQFSTLNADSEP